MKPALKLVPESGRPLEGRVALIVEDESLVSMLAEAVLTNAGCIVMLAMRLSEAMDAATNANFDIAVLDVNLGKGENSYPVADVLIRRGIPFVFATGYDPESLDPRFKDYPKLQKPYRINHLVETVQSFV